MVKAFVPAANSRSTIDVSPPNFTPANGTAKMSCARAGAAIATSISHRRMARRRADGSMRRQSQFR